MSSAAPDEILPRFGIAAAHRSSPATPRGIPPSKSKRKQEKPDTHGCRDWRQLHEPVRADGTDVPRRPGGRVRRGDARSNQQPGIHSLSKVVNEKRFVCDTDGPER